jgi:WLM domain
VALDLPRRDALKNAAQLGLWPTPAAQASALSHLRSVLEPLLVREGLTTPFVLRPGLRLRRTYGRCTYREGSAIVIQVRCTADSDPSSWRRVGSITGTLLHELAHLRYRSHGPRFWALYRRLVNRAEAAGLYDPADRDPAERPRGERKLMRGRGV